MNTKQKVQKELDEHIEMLNTEFKEQYEDELDLEEGETVAEGIRDTDIDTIDFNIGFEQGYMRGLEVALSNFKDTE